MLDVEKLCKLRRYPRKKRNCDEPRFCLEVCSLVSPENVRDDFVAVSKVTLVERRPSFAVLLHDLAPLRRAIEINILAIALGQSRADSRRAVEMCIDEFKLLIVMRIRVLIWTRVTGVVHTCTKVQVAEILILMVQPEDVADFLAHHE